MASKVAVNEVKVRTYNVELTQAEVNTLYTLLNSYVVGGVISDSSEKIQKGALGKLYTALYQADGVEDVSDKFKATAKTSYGYVELRVDFI